MRRSESRQNTQTEFALIDLRDAFCHFGVHPRELRHCVSPGLELGTGIIWTAMLFGFKAAPYVMGRLAAALGRFLASLLNPARGQLQVYVDDIAPILKGSPQRAKLPPGEDPVFNRSHGSQRGGGEGGTRLQDPMDRHYVRGCAWPRSLNSRNGRGRA